MCFAWKARLMEMQGFSPDEAIESTLQVPRASQSVASWAAAGRSVCWQTVCVSVSV